jgi:hypothetical protein
MLFRYILSAITAFTLTFSASSYGHELMQPNWCSAPHQQIQIISTFSFEKGTDVPTYRHPNGPTHGVVDRYMGVSNNIAIHCTKAANQLVGSDYDSRAIVTSPENYLDADHHQFYNPEIEGLAGGCAICVEITPPPTPPGRGPRASIEAVQANDGSP